jgi:DNA-binding GntR family transcriptional regulator
MTTVVEDDLQHVSLRERILVIIRQRLISGAIVPGEVYSATAIASKLGVSNSPVREAMLSLVQEGVMEPIRNRGFRVIPLTDADRRNIYDLRLMLEVPSMAKLAASGLVRGRITEFETLAKLAIRADEDRDLVNFIEHDRQFHLGLIDLLGNPHLTGIVGSLRDKSRLHGLKTPFEQGALSETARDHLALLGALAEGDVAATEKIMILHLEHTRVRPGTERAGENLA